MEQIYGTRPIDLYDERSVAREAIRRFKEVDNLSMLEEEELREMILIVLTDYTLPYYDQARLARRILDESRHEDFKKAMMGGRIWHNLV